MARILLGWELGAGSGHAVKLARIAATLRARGHVPVFAAQHIGAMPPGAELWQAPLWPRQLATLSRRATAAPATMGDILAALGLDDPRALAAMLAAWDEILAASRADAVAAEYAPALMLAARGRAPLLALGTGFSLPPPQLPSFPSLTRAPTTIPEAPLLAGVNAALGSRAPLPSLPAIFAADRTIAAVFRELDPYREWRREPHGAPSLADRPAMAERPGTEVFVYMNGAQARPEGLWQGLVDARLPVRLHDPRLNAADKATLRRAGLAVEDAPLPFAEIARRSRLVVSHGPMGLTCSALVAGLPHIVLPFDIEKRMIAASVVELGLGSTLPLPGLQAKPFAELLRATHADEPLLARARTAAPGFAARLGRGCEAETVDALEEMLR